MAIINHEAELARAGANVSSTGGQILFLARRYPLGAVGALIVLLFIFTAAFANFIAPMDPTTTNAKFSLAKPGSMYWLGADFMGRDMFSRIVYGARISLAVGAGATLLGGVLGVTIGLMSGYLGGWFDLATQRVMDIMQSLPLLVMALVMAASLGPSLENTIFAIAIPLVPSVARVVRSSTLSLREQPFVEAARAVGMGEVRIAVRHVLPNTLAPLIVLATAQLGSAILTEASLSFLGLGIPEPYPSWGRMLSESAAEYVRNRRRIGIGQERDRAVDHAPDLAARPHLLRLDHLRRRGSAGQVGSGDAQDPRRADLDDLPGADDLAESGVDHRRPDHGDAAPASRLDRTEARKRAIDLLKLVEIPSAEHGSTNIRIRSRAACASA
jgi:peptide/nickel transport system permease protein